MSSSFKRTLEICNKRGLHARAAAKFAKVSGRYKADIQVSRAGQTVTGTSIMGLMMLAAAMGSEIEVETSGAEAEQALEEITLLVADKFGEDREET